MTVQTDDYDRPVRFGQTNKKSKTRLYFLDREDW